MYYLKDYTEYINDAREFWYNKIDDYVNNNSAYTNDTEATKSDLKNQVDTKLTELKTSVENYKARFPVNKLKTTLISLKTMYEIGEKRDLRLPVYDESNNTASYISAPDAVKVNVDDITSIKSIIYLYTFELPDINTLFALESGVDENTGESYITLDTAGIDDLKTAIDVLNDDENFNNFLNDLSGRMIDTSLLIVISGAKLFNKNSYSSFNDIFNWIKDELLDILNDFNIQDVALNFVKEYL